MLSTLWTEREFRSSAANLIVWVFLVIDIGVVESVNLIAGKSIVAVSLKVDLDTALLQKSA